MNARAFARRLALALLLALTLLVIAMTGVAIAGMQDDADLADVAIVLGNRIEADGEPSPRLAARLTRGLQLYRDGRVQHMIVSGGMGLEGFDEATVMRRWLITHGVPDHAIHMDHHGVDTWNTARNSARLMEARGWTRAYAVSQYFHVPRARMALRRFGVATVYGAHPHYFEWRDLYSTFREVVALLVYRLRRVPGDHAAQVFDTPDRPYLC